MLMYIKSTATFIHPIPFHDQKSQHLKKRAYSSSKFESTKYSKMLPKPQLSSTAYHVCPTTLNTT
jgi:hypothetical protein